MGATPGNPTGHRADCGPSCSVAFCHLARPAPAGSGHDSGPGPPAWSRSQMGRALAHVGAPQEGGGGTAGSCIQVTMQRNSQPLNTSVQDGPAACQALPWPCRWGHRPGIRADSTGLWDLQTGCAWDPGSQGHRTGARAAASLRQRALPAAGRGMRVDALWAAWRAPWAELGVCAAGRCCVWSGEVQVRVWRGSGVQPSGWCPVLGGGLWACPCDSVYPGGAPLLPPQGSPEPPGGCIRDPLGGGVLRPRSPADSSGSRNPGALGWADLSHWQGRRKSSVQGRSTESA